MDVITNHHYQYSSRLYQISQERLGFSNELLVLADYLI